MHIPKKYYHDKTVLTLLSLSLFTVLLNAALILLRLDDARGRYIVQYRENLGVDPFQAGEGTAFLTFIAFALIVFVFQVVLSVRIYGVHKQFAVAICSLGLLLLVLSVIVSNALLTLR